MLAKLAEEIPTGGFLYEPKWDGFRAIVFRGDSDVFIQSRDLRPLDRYFPDLHEVLLDKLPAGCVIDGEIVIAGPNGLDFDALQLRLHPAASRVAMLAKETPAAFVGFDLLAAGGRDLRDAPQSERRTQLEALLANAKPPIHLTPMTRDRAVAVQWLERFEGAGLDGVIAKPEHGTYQPGKRAMIKVKHARTADCVVAGFRWHKSGKDAVGSLLLGLYDKKGTLQHVGVTSSFTMAMRKQLAVELAPLRKHALKTTPGANGPRLMAASWRACPAGKAAGAPGKICRGSRCGSNGSARSSTTTCRAIASVTRPSSCDGGPTSRRATAATISSKSRSRTARESFRPVSQQGTRNAGAAGYRCAMQSISTSVPSGIADHRDRRPNRRVRSETADVRLVHPCEVVHVGEVDVHLQHFVHRRAGKLQRLLNLIEDVLRLRLDVARETRAGPFPDT